jgi:hypothetical protein
MVLFFEVIILVNGEHITVSNKTKITFSKIMYIVLI